MLCRVEIKSLFKFTFCALIFILFSFPALASESVFPYETDAEIQNITNEQYNEVKSRIEDYYLNTLDGATSGVANKYLKGKSFEEIIYSIVFKAYDAIYKSAIYLGGLSVLIGVSMCLITKKNKGLFKWFLTRLVIGFPVLLTIFIFGVGALR